MSEPALESSRFSSVLCHKRTRKCSVLSPFTPPYGLEQMLAWSVNQERQKLSYTFEKNLVHEILRKSSGVSGIDFLGMSFCGLDALSLSLLESFGTSADKKWRESKLKTFSSPFPRFQTLAAEG